MWFQWYHWIYRAYSRFVCTSFGRVQKHCFSEKHHCCSFGVKGKFDFFTSYGSMNVTAVMCAYLSIFLSRKILKFEKVNKES